MHFFTGKQLPRRTFLRGAMGATVALPFLDAMVAAKGIGALDRRGRAHPPDLHRGGPRPRRLQQVGRDQEPVRAAPRSDRTSRSRTTARCRRSSRIVEHLTIVSNTDVRMAEAFTAPEIGGDHFRSSAVFLTQSHPKQTQGSDIWAGTSFDQIYAQQYGKETPMPSMQFCIENLDQAGGCTYNYSCAYTDSISWASPNEPLPMIRDPRVAFDMLFGIGGSSARSRRAPRHPPQHPRLDPGRSRGRCKQGARRQRPHAPRSLPELRARNRAPHPGHRSAQHQRRRARAAGRAGRRARFVPGAHAADVRPAGARAADRHDAHHHVQDRPRLAEPRLPGKRHQPAVPPRVAPRRSRRPDPGVQQDLQVPRQPGAPTCSIG